MGGYDFHRTNAKLWASRQTLGPFHDLYLGDVPLTPAALVPRLVELGSPKLEG